MEIRREAKSLFGPKVLGSEIPEGAFVYVPGVTRVGKCDVVVLLPGGTRVGVSHDGKKTYPIDCMMCVQQKIEPETGEFGDVQVGQVFEHDGEVFMKTNNDNDITAVKLSDGTEWEFEYDEAATIIHGYFQERS